MKTITNLTVRSYHIDYFGHVNHARYVELLEEARWQYLEKNKLLGPIHEVGAFHVVAELLIKYRKPSIVGDVLQIETQIESRLNHGFKMSQKAVIVQSGDLALEAVITNVFVDGKGQPRLIDDDILRIWPDLAESICL
jgi:thioesterase-3